MMDTTYVIEKNKTIPASEQKLCDVCKLPATSAALDAIETPTGWTQGEWRHGCNEHPVFPLIKRLE